MTPTADQLTTAIANAVKAGDAAAIETLLLALTKVDPKRAGEVWETIKLGLALVQQFDGSRGGGDVPSE